MDSLNKRNIRNVILILFCLIFLSIVVVSYNEEIGNQRYSGLFLDYISLITYDRVDFDNYTLIPFFDDPTILYTQYPSEIRSIIRVESNFPNLVSLFLIINLVTGILPKDIISMPLGILVCPILYYIIIRKLLGDLVENNFLLIALFSCYALIYTAYTQSSFYVGPPTTILILLCFFCLLKIIKSTKEAVA